MPIPMHADPKIEMQKRMHREVVELVAPEVARLCRQAYIQGRDLGKLTIVIVDASCGMFDESWFECLSGVAYRGTLVGLLTTELALLKLSGLLGDSPDLTAAMLEAIPKGTVRTVSVVGRSVNVTLSQPYILFPGGTA